MKQSEEPVFTSSGEQVNKLQEENTVLKDQVIRFKKKQRAIHLSKEIRTVA